MAQRELRPTIDDATSLTALTCNTHDSYIDEHMRNLALGIAADYEMHHTPLPRSFSSRGIIDNYLTNRLVQGPDGQLMVKRRYHDEAILSGRLLLYQVIRTALAMDNLNMPRDYEEVTMVFDLPEN